MKWEVEYTDEFGNGWATLTEPEQESVKATVELLGEFGPNLRYPHSSGIAASKHDHLRELRIQHAGRPYRVLCCTPSTRAAVPSCCGAVTRRATRAGTTSMSPGRVACTMRI